MSELSERISVFNEYTPFGRLRKKGTLVYDKSNKKMYLLNEQGFPRDCLNSISSKKELGQIVTTHTLTIGDNGVIFGFSDPNGIGSLVPTTIGTETLKRVESVVGNVQSVQTVAEGKIDGANSISINFTGYGDVVHTWDTNLYRANDAGLHAFLDDNSGSAIVITITLL